MTLTDKSIISPEVYYRPPEAARRLGVSTRWLQYDRSTKRSLPFSKLGNQVLYKGADLLATLERNRIGGEA